MRWVIILLIAFITSSCSCDTDELFFSCPAPTECWIDSEGSTHLVYSPADHPVDGSRAINVTQNSFCKLGKSACVDEQVVCEGFSHWDDAPFLDICNGIDDNCNFLIDEDATRRWDNKENTCENNSGGCQQSQICTRGKYQCVLRTPEHCGEEVCDNYDNDGDGLVDESTPEEPLYPDPYVYNGPPGTDLVGECRPGKKQCIDGITEIVGEVQPSLEICSDGKDNDCDGVVDEVENPDFDAAFSMILDVSGSNEHYLFNITNAICNFASSSILPDSLFQVTFIGLSHQDAYSQIMFGTPFVDSAFLCSYLLEEPWRHNQGASEFAFEGIYATHNYSLSFLNANTSVGPQAMLLWPPGYEKRVIVFSDEQQQSLFGGVEESDIIEDCVNNEYQVGVFTELLYTHSWQNIVNQCGGFTEQLVKNANEMTNLMMLLLSGEC